MDEDPRGRFERMWTLHHARVLAYARRRAPADVADEVASEAFAVAWRRLGDVPADAGPWLLGVARNLLANRARGERRAGALVRRLGRERAATAPDPADLVGDDHGLREAFAGLSSRDREVLALVAWEGLGAREVGVVLGVPTAMASARIHRARARLRRALGARPDDRAVVPAAGRERS